MNKTVKMITDRGEPYKDDIALPHFGSAMSHIVTSALTKVLPVG